MPAQKRDRDTDRMACHDGSAPVISSDGKKIYSKPSRVRLKAGQLQQPAGSDGKLVITTVDGDLILRRLQVQAVELPTRFAHEIAIFAVLRNL
jgi:hypothetical protein